MGIPNFYKFTPYKLQKTFICTALLRPFRQVHYPLRSTYVFVCIYIDNRHITFPSFS